MNRLTRQALYCISVGVAACALSFVHSRRVHAQQWSKAVRPFTATLTTNYYRATGELGMVTVKHYARFTDRSYYSSASQTYPAPTDVINDIIDVPRGVRLITDPLTKSVMTFHSTSERLQSVVSDMGTESCPDGIDLAALPRGNDYFGHKTLHYVEQVDPNSIDDRWIVPDLECFAVTATVTFKGARNVSQANSFQEGEPPGDLKAPPSDYVERSPRAVEALHIKQSKGRSFVGDTIAKRWEAAYLRRR